MDIIEKNILRISDKHRRLLSQYIAVSLDYTEENSQAVTAIINLAIAEYEKMAQDAGL